MTANAVWYGPLFGVCASSTWAVGSAVYSRLTKDHSPFAVNCSRAIVALPCFALALLMFLGPQGALAELKLLSPSNLSWFALTMVASYGLGDSIFFMSTRLLGVPSALAIGSAYPLVTALLGAYLKGEWLTRPQTLGLLATVVGIVLVILHAPKHVGEAVSGDRRRKLLGVTLALVTLLMWVLNNFAVAQISREFSPVGGNVYRMLFSLLFCSLMGLVLRRPLALPMPVLRRNLLPITLEAVGGSWFYLLALGNTTLAVGAVTTSLAPIISVPVALAFGLEKISFWRTVGVCLAVTGVCLLVGGGV